MTALLYISEQHQGRQLENISEDLKLILLNTVYKKVYRYKPEMVCFQLYNEEQKFTVDTNYFVGVDWLVPGEAALYIEPKLNDSLQVNFLKMLLDSLEAPENLDHLDSLFDVEYDSPWITIPEQKDLLSPILIVQFLKLVQRIVRKGLKKSYYRVTENLDSRIKGKVLVSKQIKENAFKNRLTKTICNYQEYGINNEENRFLKLILKFISSYISQKSHFFNPQQKMQLQNILNYCLPAFQSIEEHNQPHIRIKIKKNIFYKEYEEAIKIGRYILNRFSFNINKASQSQTSTPPFWIDMSKLFELYVFGKLKKIFPDPNAVTHHDKFAGGKETDILIRADGYKCVIDCKYKPQYQEGSPSLEDKRQLAGYTRLKRVYEKLEVQETGIVKGVIIYSHQESSDCIEKNNLFAKKMGEYVEFYKVGVKLPEIG